MRHLRGYIKHNKAIKCKQYHILACPRISGLEGCPLAPRPSVEPALEFEGLVVGIGENRTGVRD